MHAVGASKMNLLEESVALTYLRTRPLLKEVSFIMGSNADIVALQARPNRSSAAIWTGIVDVIQ